MYLKRSLRREQKILVAKNMLPEEKIGGNKRILLFHRGFAVDLSIFSMAILIQCI